MYTCADKVGVFGVQGLQDGLQSLRDGGVQPRTLIIDDGWQSVEVDEVFKESITTRALRRMRMPATETMDEEFDESEVRVLAEYAELYAGSRDLSNTMPTLSDTGTTSRWLLLECPLECSLETAQRRLMSLRLCV
jgi:hypothetical protein